MRRILILTVCAVAGALAAFVISTNNAWAPVYLNFKPPGESPKVNPPKSFVNPPKSFGGSPGSKYHYYSK